MVSADSAVPQLVMLASLLIESTDKMLELVMHNSGRIVDGV